MITSEQALETILTHSRDFGQEIVPLTQSTGRVLAETIVADRDFPPFDRVSMDGIAIQYRHFHEGQRVFRVEGIQAAGSPQKTLEDPKACIEVMTGAMLPEKTDTVIRYEDLVEEEGGFRITAEIVENQNVHNRAYDRRSEDILLEKRGIISPAEIGILATIGKSGVRVSGLPKTIIISTGDELVEVSEQPAPHQIRKSNVHALGASLSAFNIHPDHLHLTDTYEEIRNKMKAVLKEYDLVLVSGAVSKGKFDFVPQVFEEIGVNKCFHRVSQRPGKPLWFGYKDQCVIFAFPGNPVSTQVCYLKYCEPWIRKSLGLSKRQKEYVALAKDVNFKPELTYFMQAKVRSLSNGVLQAIPIRGKGSGDLANMLDVNGFVELPKGKNTFRRGEVYSFIRFRIQE